MLIDIVEAQAREAHKLHVRFADGVEGVVDISKYVSFTGVFAPLRDPEYFRRMQVDPELGTVVWPNGSDVDPDVLYSDVTGSPLFQRSDFFTRS
jgi:hypothetical protein